MVLEYAENYESFEVADKALAYSLQRHEVDSEESLLGLGLTQNNKRTWF